MDDLCFKIDIVLNECSKVLCNIEESNELFCTKLFKNFVNGPLLQFVKSIQLFLKTSKCKNIYMIYVCLSQIRKCLLLYEATTLEQNTIINFDKVLTTYLVKRIKKCFYKVEDYVKVLDISDIEEYPGIFIDQMNFVLYGLNKKENFEFIKPNIDKIVIQALTIAKVSEKIDNLEITSASKYVLKAIQHFDNINETDNFFKFDYLSSSLTILERRINTTVLHLISKIFNDPYFAIKKLIRKCGDSVDTQLKNVSDLSYMISDLDKSTDILIQIGLFSVACCKNNNYVIPLKCCISSLELLDSDMVPAVIEFYLDPKSIVKKTFLKLLVNHWVSEISVMKHLLDKIIDPFAFTQVTLETLINIIDTICKTKTNIDLYKSILNNLVNFTNYIDQIFSIEISKENEFSENYKLFKDAINEYKACFNFIQKSNLDYSDEMLNKKLIKRCEIIIKYLKNILTSIGHIIDNKLFEFSEIENTNYIFSKTKQSFTSFLQNDNIEDNINNDWNHMLSTIQIKKSFYNKSEQKNSNKIMLDNNLINANETIYGNTVIMDLTNILDNFIETLNIDDNKTIHLWEEICIDTPTRIHDLEEVDNKIINVKEYC